MDNCVKSFSFLQDWASLQLTFSPLSQTGSLRPSWRANTDLPSPSSHRMPKAHLLPPLQLRISFRLHFLYSFSTSSDITPSYTQTTHASRQAMPVQTGEARCERLLSAACAERRAVLSGAQIKGGAAGLRSSVKRQLCSPGHSEHPEEAERTEERMEGGKDRGARSCLIHSWRIYLMHLQPRVFFLQSFANKVTSWQVWSAIFAE